MRPGCSDLPKVSSPSLAARRRAGRRRYRARAACRDDHCARPRAAGVRASPRRRASGDVLYVSGSLGEAAAGLAVLRSGALGDAGDPLVRRTGLRSRASHWAARCVVAPPQRWTSRMACSATSASCAPRVVSARDSTSIGCRSRMSSRDDTRAGSASNSRCAAATTTNCCSRCPPWTRAGRARVGAVVCVAANRRDRGGDGCALHARWEPR